VRYHFGWYVAEGKFPQTGGLPVSGWGQRCKRLDQVLFRMAASVAGVTAHTGAQVEGPLRENGRVVGIFVNGQLRRAGLYFERTSCGADSLTTVARVCTTRERLDRA
jgi:hypothetical protein